MRGERFSKDSVKTYFISVPKVHGLALLICLIQSFCRVQLTLQTSLWFFRGKDRCQVVMKLLMPYTDRFAFTPAVKTLDEEPDYEPGKIKQVRYPSVSA